MSTKGLPLKPLYHLKAQAESDGKLRSSRKPCIIERAGLRCIPLYPPDTVSSGTAPGVATLDNLAISNRAAASTAASSVAIMFSNS